MLIGDFYENFTEPLKKAFSKEHLATFSNAWASKYNPLAYLRKLGDILANGGANILEAIGIPANVAQGIAGVASGLLEAPLDATPVGPLVWIGDGVDAVSGGVNKK